MGEPGAVQIPVGVWVVALVLALALALALDTALVPSSGAALAPVASRIRVCPAMTHPTHKIRVAYALTSCFDHEASI